MGTRADFYVIEKEKFEWLGSIPFDGYPDYRLSQLLPCETIDDYLYKVSIILQDEDATKPNMGWPWPWEDSKLTDYTYVWEKGMIKISEFGREWKEIDGRTHFTEELKEESINWDFGDGAKMTCFPNMSDIRNVTLGNRSGLIVLKKK